MDFIGLICAAAGGAAQVCLIDYLISIMLNPLA